ncbi:hypothetical protein RHMOL_Rhmol02G0200100 [Rhododendron molle]|uniref:Uncharacterized protein n=1 Tax=Rhododendron molle TaxID=49168 RepID=A0ACC0PTG1_RHOML|nr:hypothetical protein RHMOL_Rhmol02G0200100 [Rhododendron molle]
MPVSHSHYISCTEFITEPIPFQIYTFRSAFMIKGVWYSYILDLYHIRLLEITTFLGLLKGEAVTGLRTAGCVVGFPP